LLVVFFFFQAEDGIRDPLVTGVQTCALPISASAAAGFADRQSSMWDVPRKKTRWFEHVFRMSSHHCAAGRDRYTRVSRGEAVARSEERRVGKEWRARRAGEEG